MKKLLIILPVFLLLVSCADDLIIGQWERFGDDAEGAVVQVEIVGKGYHGKLIKTAGILTDLGFAANEIKWRDIEPVGPNKWRGKDLNKKVDLDGNITEVEYRDVYFDLMDDGVLEIRTFAKESKMFGQVQRWRRIE